MTIDEAIKFVQNINTQGSSEPEPPAMPAQIKMEITLLTVTKHFMIQIPMHVMQ